MIGNFPQAFSHIGLINAASTRGQEHTSPRPCEDNAVRAWRPPSQRSPETDPGLAYRSPIALLGDAARAPITIRREHTQTGGMTWQEAAWTPW